MHPRARVQGPYEKVAQPAPRGVSFESAYFLRPGRVLLAPSVRQAPSQQNIGAFATYWSIAKLDDEDGDEGLLTVGSISR